MRFPLLVLLAACLSTVSCRRPASPAKVDQLDATHLALYAADTNTVGAQSAADSLRELVPGLKEVRQDSLEADLEACAADGRVVLVTSPSHLSLDDWPLFESFIQSGGRLLLIGHHPFSADVRVVHDERETYKTRMGHAMARAEGLANFSEVARWEQQSDPGSTHSTVRLVEPPIVPWPGVLVDVENFTQYHVVQSSRQPHGLSSEEENAIALYARGGRSTTRMVVSFEDKEELTWHRSIQVTERWQPYLLPLNTFHPLEHEQATRTLAFRDIRQVRIGLDSQRAPQAPGSRQYGVSDLRLMKTEDAKNIQMPDEFFFAHPSASFKLRSSTLQSVLSGKKLTSTINLAWQSPVPCSLRGGFDGEQPFTRWVPVGEIRSEEGFPLGWPASIYVRPGPLGEATQWGWIGLEPSEISTTVLQPLLTECVSRMLKGWFLFDCGTPGFCVKAGEPLSARVGWLGKIGEKGLRISGELIDSSGFVLRKVISEVDTRDSEHFRELNLGMLPKSLSGQRDIKLRIQLEDPRNRGEVIDALVQDLKVLGPAHRVSRTSRIAVAGPRFTYRKRPTTLLGVTYAPAGQPGGREGTTRADWLHPAYFNPEVIRRDLDHLSRAGINALSIAYDNVAQASQLRFFATEAQSRQLWLQLDVAGLDPLSPDWSTAQALMEAAEIQSMLPVYALTLGHNANLGNKEARRTLDPLWHNWLVEQYGSIANARNTFGTHLNTYQEEVTGPTDKELHEDGPHRLAVAAYRRFIEDMISREFGVILRALRGAGYDQLTTASIPFHKVKGLAVDASAVGHHLDYITADMGSLYQSGNTIEEAGFVAAYARAASNGKPVSWSNIQFPTGTPSNPSEYTFQAQCYSRAFDTALRSHVHTCFAPAQLWKAQTRDMVHSVMGLNGKLHPLREAFQTFSQKVRKEKTVPRVWSGRTASRYTNARGMMALWEEFREAYTTEIQENQLQEMRWPAFGKMTSDITPVTLDGSNYQAPQPLRDVNSEWGAIKVNGTVVPWLPGDVLTVRLKDKLEMELLNTGAATWASSKEDQPGTVWLEARHEERNLDFNKVRTTGFGGLQRINWIASDLGSWTLRPLLQDFGTFGEPLVVNVQPVRPRLRP